MSPRTLETSSPGNQTPRVRGVPARRLADRRRLLRRCLRRQHRPPRTLEGPARRAGRAVRDTLLVYRVDRFSRSLRDLTGLLDELTDAQVVFRSATEPFDTATPVGRMLVQMLGVFAEFERETIIDRVINGMERKAAKGLWTGGAPPLRYSLDRPLNNPAPTPPEAAPVRPISPLYPADRLATQTTPTRLNHQGLRTRLGKP